MGQGPREVTGPPPSSTWCWEVRHPLPGARPVLGPLPESECPGAFPAAGIWNRLVTPWATLPSGGQCGVHLAPASGGERGPGPLQAALHSGLHSPAARPDKARERGAPSPQALRPPSGPDSDSRDKGAKRNPRAPRPQPLGDPAEEPPACSALRAPEPLAQLGAFKSQRDPLHPCGRVRTEAAACISPWTSRLLRRRRWLTQR